MAATTIKKRALGDGAKAKVARPSKKQRKMAAYHSSSEESDDGGNDDDDANESESDAGVPLPANLFDSDDEDLDNAVVDDGASSGASDSDDDDDDDENNNSDSPGAAAAAKTTTITKAKAEAKPKQKKAFVAKDAPDSSEGESDEDEEGGESDAGSNSGSDAGGGAAGRRTKSKRNDPEAFAVSISKMLSSKLPTSRRADPIVARSAAAADSARQVVDSALETKARKRLREQKRLAMEKGRVRDVLVASTTRTLNIATGEVEEVVEDGAESTGQLLATERRLRKVAQRGVVKLFNAVRAAQVKASEAERAARNEGIPGVKRKEEKVTEMSRKGFLDLIASGGGGLKKGGLEEA
ncbi:Rrp15p-domain-containing protein [Podospora appendiculata]|uniref:Rrp15p-domain-containing protein n=1 Tax=Podospora appendiculata TaxID=314037 RepID=A0AAE0X5C2_9PEZI|nr:Rrp15p-domain-containing protein [Podospora appendiculata]